MEHDWKKATLIPAVAAKTGTRQIFKGGGGSPSLQGGTTPKFNEIGDNFYMI